MLIHVSTPLLGSATFCFVSWSFYRQPAVQGIYRFASGSSNAQRVVFGRYVMACLIVNLGVYGSRLGSHILSYYVHIASMLISLLYMLYSYDPRRSLGRG